MKQVTELPPIEGIIFMHQDAGACFREVKDRLLTDSILSLQGEDVMNPEFNSREFYGKELGADHIMLVTNVIHPPEGGVKYKDVLRLDMKQFGKWTTWEEFFQIAQKAITTFTDPATTFVEFEQEPKFNQTGSQE